VTRFPVIGLLAVDTMFSFVLVTLPVSLQIATFAHVSIVSCVVSCRAVSCNKRILDLL